MVNNRCYPGGKEISTERGERIRSWFRKRKGYTFAFGVTFKTVLFADHRGGWSGLQMQVDLGWWRFIQMVFVWKNGPPEECITISLAEQIRRTHHSKSLEELERREEEEKADERERMALFDKMLKESNHQRNN